MYFLFDIFANISPIIISFTNMTAKSWMFALLKEMLVDKLDPEAPCKIYVVNEQMKDNFSKYTVGH